MAVSGSDLTGFQVGEHVDQNGVFFLIDLLEILVAAVAFDAPQTGRRQFGGDPAFGVAAVRNFDGGLRADADEAPLITAPRLEPGFVLIAIIRILKQVIERMRVPVAVVTISMSTSAVRVYGETPLLIVSGSQQKDRLVIGVRVRSTNARGTIDARLPDP